MIKKKVLVAVALLLCSQLASATSITFETVFPQCKDATGIEGNLKCGVYFMLPSAHIDLLWNLVFDAFVTSLEQIGSDTLNAMFQNAHLFFNSITDLNYDNMISAVFSTLALMPVALYTWIYGIVSSVLAYILVLVIEFIKTYSQFAVGSLLWSKVLYNEVDYWKTVSDIKRGSLIVAIAMIGGSILLFLLDWNVWRLF